MTLAGIRDVAVARGLCLRGASHLTDDPVWGSGTVVLLGPDEPGFWNEFSKSPEYADRNPDPLDRWSKRIVSALARTLAMQAVFPSDGPPYPPFQKWATETGEAWVSPPGLLVHAFAGLLVSYRGALITTEKLELPLPRPMPCATCVTKPCLGACPVGALGDGTDYNVPVCARHVRSDAGADCQSRGCLVRRACPLSATLNVRTHRPDFTCPHFWEAGYDPSLDPHAPCEV